MKAVFCLLLGVAFGGQYNNPWNKLTEKKAWKNELTWDWENLNHVVAFDDWKAEFGKTYYNHEEEAHRFIVFLDNWKMINEFNKGIHNYTMRMNQFGDMTPDEFRYYVHGHGESCLKKRSVYERRQMNPVVFNGDDAPASVDWTNVNGKSYVSPVKNQGQCGSCWAFSSTGSIESAAAIKTGKTGSSLIQLSEQQLVDCSGSYGNQGCNGGLMDNAFKYVKATGGLCTETAYPYTAVDGKCKASSCTMEDAISGYHDVQADSETSLEAAVAQQPVSIAIEADQSAFQFYSSGVLDGKCGTRLDHGVLAVGYGTQGSQEFWKVKNSWGASWGDNGYVLICRHCNKNGNQGECGILMQPSFPDAQ